MYSTWLETYTVLSCLPKSGQSVEQQSQKWSWDAAPTSTMTLPKEIFITLCPTVSSDLLPLPPLHHQPLFPFLSQLLLLPLSSLPKRSYGNGGGKKGGQLRQGLLPWPVNCDSNFSPRIIASMNEGLGMPQKPFSLHLQCSKNIFPIFSINAQRKNLCWH